MKKNRQSFFAENAMNYNMYNPNNLISANAPFQSSNSESSFYSGPYPYNQNNDLEGRLAKIERQINRLESRINKLEQNSTISTEDIESNVNNMYMV